MERDDWWNQVSALTVVPEMADPAGHPRDCEDLAGWLVQLAGALTLTQTFPGTCACGPGPCRFKGTPGGAEACALIPLLAVARARPRRHRRIPDTREELRHAYLCGLRAAAAAVCHCRRTRHSGGDCWFTPPGSAEDVCGRVLHVAHLLSEPVRRI